MEEVLSLPLRVKPYQNEVFSPIGPESFLKNTITLPFNVAITNLLEKNDSDADVEDFELYNLKEDPFEINNLVGQNKEKSHFSKN